MKGLKRFIAMSLAALLVFSTAANDYMIVHAEEEISEDTEAAEEKAVEESEKDAQDVPDVTEEEAGEAQDGDDEVVPDTETVPVEEVTGEEASEGAGEVETEVGRLTYIFMNDGEVYDEQIVKNGETLYEPGVPTSAAGEFIGWFKDGGKFTGFGTVSIADDVDDTVTLIATYRAADEKVYHVYFYGADRETVLVTKQAKSGSAVDTTDVTFVVDVSSQAVTGWETADGTPVGSSVSVTDADIRLYPTIKEVKWVTFDTKGGTPVAPVHVLEGDCAAKPVDPAKDGYAFEGWYADADCNTPYTFAEAVTSDTTVYANWTAKEVEYKIVYWLENANDDKYSFGGSEYATAAAGADAVAAVPDKTAAGFTYDHMDEKKVAGDGSTVVNVYYTRNVYQIRFYTRADKKNCYTGLTITAKHGAYIADKWPSVVDSKMPAHWLVLPQDSARTMQHGIEVMPIGGKEFAHPGEKGNYTYKLKYMLQSEDNPKVYVEYREDSRNTDRSNLKFTAEDFYPITGFVYNQVDSGHKVDDYYKNEKCEEKITGGWFKQYTYTNWLFYDRQSYDIIFYDGKTQLRKDAVAYNASIDGYKDYKASKDGYDFLGWYENEEGVGDAYSFAGKKMPAAPIVLYAQWEENKFTVSFDVNGGDNEIESQKVKPNGYIAPFDAPTKAGYKFAGWVDESGEPFNLKTPITRDTNLKAMWLYDGYITVVYKSSNVTVNEGKYSDGTYTKVIAAPSDIPEGKAFLGWQLDGQTYYPEATFQVQDALADENKVILLTALYGDKAGETELIYVANNGTDESLTVPGIQKNSKITVGGIENTPFTYADHEFIGWKDNNGKAYAKGAQVYIDKIAGNTLTAQWAALADYTVNYYLVDSETPVAESTTGRGRVGTSVEAVAKEVAGYTLADDTTTKTLTLDNGENVINFYYKVAEITIKIVGETDTRTYSGAAQSVTGIKDIVKPEGSYPVNVALKDGCVAEASGTNADTYYMGLTEADFNITSDYYAVVNVEIEDGYLVIEPAAVTVTAKDAEKVYGTDDPAFEADVEGLIGEDTIENISFTREPGEAVGTYVITPSVNEISNNYTVTYNTGTLTIKEFDGEITITTTVESEEIIYDGQNHYAEVVVTGLPAKGYTVEVAKSDAVAKDVTTEDVEATCDALVIVNDEGVDVTENLKKVYVDSSFRIVPAKLSVVIPSIEKEYDGVAVTPTATVEGLVEGETLDVTVLTKDVKDVTRGADGKAVPVPVEYTLGWGSETGSATRAILSGLFGNDNETLSDKAKASNYVLDESGVGTILITPATLKVTTYSAVRIYNGRALTAGGEYAGLKGNDTISFTTTGSQKEVGSSVNTYEILWLGALQSNYDVEEHLGTLTVNAVPADDTTPDETPTPGDDTTPGTADDAAPADAAGVLGARRGVEADTSSVLGASRTQAVLGARRGANTGDENAVVRYLMMMGLSASVAGIYTIAKRKKRNAAK